MYMHMHMYMCMDMYMYMCMYQSMYHNVAACCQCQTIKRSPSFQKSKNCVN